MKPTSKQLSVLQRRIASRYSASGRSNAEIGRLASVHPSQVGRICAGNFKTVSANVVQVCRVLGVKVPKMVESAKIDPEWAKANASLRRARSQPQIETRAFAMPRQLRAARHLAGVVLPSITCLLLQQWAESVRECALRRKLSGTSPGGLEAFRNRRSVRRSYLLHFPMPSIASMLQRRSE